MSLSFGYVLFIFNINPFLIQCIKLMFVWPTLVILDFMVGNIGIRQVIELAKMQYFFTLVEKADPQK